MRRRPFRNEFGHGEYVFTDVLLKPDEAAAFLKVSLSWLAKARAANEGPPFIRIGRCVRYSKPGLQQWLKSRQRLSTSEE
jgi:hypothetical protein